MPTINQLAPATAAGDGDILPISQGGKVRGMTRAQLLSGYQPTLALTPGTLLGRISGGVGGAEAVTVAAPLTFMGGVLSGPAAPTLGGLALGTVPTAVDRVAMVQGGRDVAVPFGAAMTGLGALQGINLSGHLVKGRRLSDWMSDAAPVEAYGAIGDGVADDSAALIAAIASGRPVRLGASTYVVNGQFTIAQSTILLGVPGQTVLRRQSQAGGAWISVQGPSFIAQGIIFDAGAMPGDSWGVLVTPACTSTLFDLCVFKAATGLVLGHGLTVQARDGLTGSPSQHRVLRSVFTGNQQHGLWVQAAAGVLIEGCEAHGNGAFGLCLDYNDLAFVQKAQQGRVVGCRAWQNQRGISVGNFNQTNAEPPVWGTLNPDAIGVLVSGNVCYENTAYGIAVSGLGLLVTGNEVSAGPGSSGILLNAQDSRVSENVVSGVGAQFGIDAGGCINCELSGNHVQGFAAGLNPGGGHRNRVLGNMLADNVWGITAYNVETDGHGRNFGLSTDGLSLESNHITLRDGSGGGIFLIDAPQGVAVQNNAFFGGPACSPSQALWAHTDQLVLRGNHWNNQSRLITNPSQVGSRPVVLVPDVLDEAMITAAPQPVLGIMGQHQAAMIGQIAFVKVSAGGSGYTSATVAIGGAGSGASAEAYVRDGVVIGIAVTASGSGYAGGATVAISGDGAGATATVAIGLPVPEGRHLRILCNGAVRFQRAGSSPFVDNWTGADITVPAASAVDFVGAWSGWQAVVFASADYIAPTGDGGLIVRTSAAGDLTLKPAAGGRVRVGSDAEPLGFVTTLGHGSPEGVVMAPPGSDYRNLDGGAGSTLWIKRSGAGTSGWFAVG